MSFAVAARLPAQGPATSREEARGLENPLPYSKASIRQGRRLYLRLCQICHGADGKALENIDFEATNLTEPRFYRHGSSDGDIFYSTREGAGFEMPSFQDKMQDEEIWHVVNFIRSIGPEDLEPGLVEVSDGNPANGGAP